MTILKRQWFGVFSHGITIALFTCYENAQRWGEHYFANNTPWNVQPVETPDGGIW